MIADLYRVASAAAEPLAPLLLRVRALRGKEDPSRLPERLGRGGGERPAGRLVWVHAASVGEAVSVLPLIERIAGSGAGTVLMTTGTVASAKVVADRLPAGSLHRYAPLDVPGAVRRFLRRWRPDAALWVESELWPNLLAGTRGQRIPTALVNGRMSPRSFARWRRLPSMARTAIGGFDAVLARSAADAVRLSGLGARNVVMTGDLKAAARPLPVDEAELARLSDAVGARPAWVAASTHAGEERLIGEVHRRIKAQLPDLLTVVAPRHAGRAERVGAALRESGLAVVRRSGQASPGAGTDILLGDTMGEMGLYLRLGNPVFVGKSLLRGGGHNPREAALLGRAVLFGPHMENFAEAAANLLAAGAAIAVPGPDALTHQALRLLRDPQAARSMGGSGRRVVRAEAEGVLDAVWDALAPVIAAQR